MNLNLTDDEALALIRLLRDAIDDDRYPLSPRILTLSASLRSSIRSRSANPRRPEGVCATASNSGQKASGESDLVEMSDAGARRAFTKAQPLFPQPMPPANHQVRRTDAGSRLVKA